MSLRALPMLVLLLPGLASAESIRYRIDPVHSRVLLRVDHLGFARSMATLSGPVGHIDYDAAAPERSRVEVSLPLARVDFGDEEWNRQMARRVWFDSERHPQAQFRSTAVRVQDDGGLAVDGMLTLRGEQVPVRLNARINRIGRIPPFANRETLGASATAELSRAAFGMRRHPRVIGDAVELWIEVEAAREGRSPAADAPDTRTPDADQSEQDHADLQQP